MKRTASIVAFASISILSGLQQTPAGTSERIVTDRFSGLAIGGFDPVAYFANETAQEGRGDFEWSAGGAVWRFRNEGNRAAFAARPDIYAPQFGGYDPVDVARGVARAGQPRIWLIADRKLYLFADAANREAFIAASDEASRAAREAWPAVEARLAR